MKKILVYGYGNPGRQDDGLGILLAEKIDTWAKNNNHNYIKTDTNYQLNIEDAYGLNEFDYVIFADASINCSKNFTFETIQPLNKTEFTMHSVSPGFVIDLCKKIYNEVPNCQMLQIKGYEWEFMIDPSKKALINLETAFNFLTNHISTYIKNE